MLTIGACCVSSYLPPVRVILVGNLQDISLGEIERKLLAGNFFIQIPIVAEVGSYVCLVKANKQPAYSHICTLRYEPLSYLFILYVSTVIVNWDESEGQHFPRFSRLMQATENDQNQH